MEKNIIRKNYPSTPSPKWLFFKSIILKLKGATSIPEGVDITQLAWS